jgi:putative component of membrane protein insertase Oxa1/YidC/SpoIIIJ protein YidD
MLHRNPFLYTLFFALGAALLFGGCAVNPPLIDPQADNSASSSETTNPALYPLLFFKKYISSADGDRCSMSPTCSSYSMDAFSRHGFFVGWMMTCDRLMRCGRDETNRCQKVYSEDKMYCHDPVEQNDFWWNSPSSDDFSTDS